MTLHELYVYYYMFTQESDLVRQLQLIVSLRDNSIQEKWRVFNLHSKLYNE